MDFGLRSNFLAVIRVLFANNYIKYRCHVLFFYNFPLIITQTSKTLLQIVFFFNWHTKGNILCLKPFYDYSTWTFSGAELCCFDGNDDEENDNRENDELNCDALFSKGNYFFKNIHKLQHLQS